MLVSAAIDPYKKSYGNSRSSSATDGVSTASERMAASPRNTCVPGVHACATAGVSTRIASATRTSGAARAARRRCLDAKTLALAPHGATQVAELVCHGVIDCVACLPHIVRNMLADFV